MGDTSDNIPGVPSIGEKTATKIIVEYGSIENAYAHVSELKPPRASKALQEHYDLAEMSKTLATICLDADLEYEIEEARIGNLFTSEAYEYFRKLQFKNLLAKFEAEVPVNEVEKHFLEVTEREELRNVLEKANEAEWIGISLEKDEEHSLPLFADMGGYSAAQLHSEIRKSIEFRQAEGLRWR